MHDRNQDKRWIVYAILREDPYQSLHVGDDGLLCPTSTPARQFQSADEAIEFIKAQESSPQILAWGMILDWRAPRLGATQSR